MANVLVVDDESGIRKTVAAFLKKDGHEVQLAESAVIALELLDEMKFDVIVTDIVMPLMTGVELLEAVRARGLKTKVIMTTGEPTATTAAAAVRAGAYDYLSKPVKRDKILTVVRRAAEARELERMNAHYQENLESLVQDRTRQLFETEHRFRALTEESPVGICTTVEGKLAYVNPALRTLLGYDEGEMEGSNSLDHFIPEDQPRASSRSKALLHGGVEYSSDYTMIHKEGHLIPVQIMTHAIHREMKPALLNVIQDLSQRLEAEQQRVDLKIATSRLLVQEVLAGLLPGLMRSFAGTMDPSLMMSALGERIEEVLRPRYFVADDEKTPAAVAEQTLRFFSDSGGVVEGRMAGTDRHEFEVDSCPWNNEEKKEPTLCQLCSVIVGSFSRNYSEKSTSSCTATRAEGAAQCRFSQVFVP